MSSTSAVPWTELKNEGRDAFNAQEYDVALVKYQAALNSTSPSPPPSYEKQILLSNIVACRLKLGSRMHLLRAKEEAQQCIQLNPRWSKGHVRLGSVYQALGGGHSNDACQCFQRALQLDPTNPTARSLLTQELRRGTPSTSFNSSSTDENLNSNDSSSEHPSNTSSTSTRHPAPSAPPFPTNSVNVEEEVNNRDSNGNTRHGPNDMPYSSYFSSTRSNERSSQSTGRTRPRRPVDDIDDQLSWPQRLQHMVSGWTEKMQYQLLKLKWNYSQLSDDRKAILKVAIVLLILYVGFGGRFGFEQRNNNNLNKFGDYKDSYSNSHYPYQSSSKASSYSTTSGNRRTTASSSSTSKSRRQDVDDDYNQNYNFDDDDEYDYYTSQRRARERRHRESRSSWSLSNFEIPYLFDGSLPSMFILAGIAYACHKMGISPFQVIWLLNIMQGGRGRRVYRGGMGTGGGFGGGGGGGFGRGYMYRGGGGGGRRRW